MDHRPSLKTYKHFWRLGVSSCPRTLSLSHCFSPENSKRFREKSRIVSWPERKRELLQKILLNHYKFLLVDLPPLTPQASFLSEIFSSLIYDVTFLRKSILTHATLFTTVKIWK